MQINHKINNTAFFNAAIAIFCLYYSILMSLPGYVLLQGPDTLWHIRIGQWILSHGQVPRVDYFSYTAVGKPWISTEWLSEIFFAGAFNIGGWRAVLVLAAILCAVTIGLLCYYLLQNLRFSAAIGWAALSAVMISKHFLARPHMFSYILLIIWVVKLLDAYDRDDFKLSSLFTFVPLMALWANLHGSFTLGLVLLYVFTGFSFCESAFRHHYSQSWRTLIVAVVVTLSALLTPYGIAPVLETVKAVKMSYANHHINEMKPPDFQEAHIVFLFFLGLLAAIPALGVRLRGARLIAFSVILAMALTYVRGIVIFFLLAPILLARPVAACVAYFAPRSGDPKASGEKQPDPVLQFLQKRTIMVPAVCTALAVIMTASVGARTDIGPPASAPKAAIDFVRHENITGNVFNSYGFGGFLIFSGIPTFVDGRSLLYGDTFMKRYFQALDLVDIDDAFNLLNEYKVDWIILRPSEPITKALARSPAWDQVYSDKYSVVFTRHRA